MKLQFKTAHGAFVGLAVAALMAPAHAQFSKISEAEEIEAGRQSARQAVKEFGQPLPANHPTARRVARLGAMFAAQSKRRNIPFSYTVLQNDKVLNAFAAPGGPIFVTTKLISTAANDAELAYVLGHETGHIERKHIVNQVQKQQKLGLGVGILGAILGRGKSNQAVDIAASLAVAGLRSSYSRADENDSDDYGVRAMARLGFDPRAAVSMLGKLGGSAGGLQKYLATHPAPESRQKRVSQLIQKENLLGVAQSAGGPHTTLAGNASAGYAPSYSSTSTSDNGYQSASSTNDSIPLRVQTVNGYRVVLAPVAALANYAGGRTNSRSNQVTVSRGNAYATFAVNSAEAILNGRRVQMSAPARIIDNRLYAPLGTVAEGLDGSATFDANRNAVRLDFGSGRTGYAQL